MNSELILKRVAALTLSCDALARTIRGFEVILRQENEAISRSDINELEAITQHKVYFGDKVDSAVQEIRKIVMMLDGELRIKSLDKTSEIQLSSVLQALLASPLGQSEAAEPRLAALARSIEDLRNSRTEIFPKIEANAYMVNKLLQYHRETYAFWQSIAQDSEAIYGKSGKTVASGQRSILTVRT